MHRNNEKEQSTLPQEEKKVQHIITAKLANKLCGFRSHTSSIQKLIM